MGRVTTVTLGLSLLALVACGSTEEGEESLPPVTAETKQTIDEIFAHLNNTSRSERWLNSLVEVGSAARQNRKYVLDHARGKIETSLRRNGSGPGVLRPGGRKRVFEAVGQLGDGPAARSLLQLGLDDPVEECRAAAAIGLAGWGDEATIPTLVDLVLGCDDAELRQKILQSLRRLASPQRRLAFLNALRPEAQELLEPIVLGTFPEGAQRAPALREVAGGHASPYARAFALRVLTDLGDPHLRALAQKALDSEDPVLRPVALAALGSSGGSSTEQIERELRADPADPEAVVKGLYKASSIEALRRAISVFTDAELQPATRSAVATIFLARVGHPRGPAAYRGDEAVRITRVGIRSVLGFESDPGVLIAAAAALGRVGDAAIDGEILLGLLQTPEADVGRAVVGALGRLGGELAAAKLVELIDVDPALRASAGEALGRFSEPRDVPVDMLIDLLEHPDDEARVAAITGLRGLNGGDAMGYEPDGSDGERAAGVDAWRSWWEARSE